jgi:carboxyl-terminal processing protease
MKYLFRSFAAALCTAMVLQLPLSLESLRAAGPATGKTSGITVSVEDVLTDGLRLEEQRSWGEAIHFYETGLRTFKDDPQLSQRLLICRIHNDVARRYEDASFRQSIQTMSTEQSLELYSEILSSLDTQYVEAPQWSRVLRYGTASLEVALTEPRFVEMNLSGVPADRIESFRQSIHRQVLSRPADTQFDLRASASHVAGIARRELGLAGTATVMEYVCGAISTLDPYSRFLTSSQLDETFSNIEGNFVGLGVGLEAGEDHLKIVTVIPGGPAEEAGIEVGDWIISVAGTSTASNNPDAVADLLRGPENSQVALTLQKRDGSEVAMNVARRRVDVPSVENVRIIDEENGIGYFRLTNFQKTTTRDVENALWNLHRQGMRSLVLDVRGNPGGLLNEAVSLADHFVTRGRIVTTRGRNIRENQEYVAHASNTWNVPLIVLIDGDSASASEIFAGAIRDLNRGRLVGQTTYGKGSVQVIFQMRSAKAGLCLTTAKFYSPNNTAISHRGVEPHVTVAPTYIAARPTEDGHIAATDEDAILTAAIQEARGISHVSLRP